jgi:CTP synthase
LSNVNSEEFDNSDVIGLESTNVITRLHSDSMRLGAHRIILNPFSSVFDLYKSDIIYERHRHRYAVNTQYIPLLHQNGMVFTGKSEEGLPEILELPKYHHPFFMAMQAHPEYKSRINRPSPVFTGFIEAALQHSIRV